MLPKGVRDFDHQAILYRSYLIKQCTTVFQKYGFLPLETPAVECLALLQQKYGEEGDQLLFKILNSGDFLSKTSKGDWLNTDHKKLLPQIAEKGLRYDLTLPLARYVATHHHQLTFPFKRYQIQPVWRADRPQKGRYREFYQCDMDIVGTKSLLCEVEILLIIIHTFESLGIQDFKIQLNHRKILTTLVKIIEHADKEVFFCATIDKIDKIGMDNVCKILSNNHFSTTDIQVLKNLFQYTGTHTDQLDYCQQYFIENQQDIRPIQDLQKILQHLEMINPRYSAYIAIDYTLARGLSYYTGPIMEVVLTGEQGGSLGGGGRYDHLTENFGLKDTSGIGFSFGIERILHVMEARKLLPKATQQGTQVLVINDGLKAYPIILSLMDFLSHHAVAVEIYLEAVRLKKQLNYAHKKNIPYVIMLHDQSPLFFVLKEMKNGQQTVYTKEDLLHFLCAKI